MKRALDSSIGLPRRSTKARSMVGFVMPDEVRRSLMNPGSPAVAMGHLRARFAANGSEFANWPADRNERVRVNVPRNAEDLLDLLLRHQVPGCHVGGQPERARSEQDVLDRRVDGRRFGAIR